MRKISFIIRALLCAALCLAGAASADDLFTLTLLTDPATAEYKAEDGADRLYEAAPDERAGVYRFTVNRDGVRVALDLAEEVSLALDGYTLSRRVRRMFEITTEAGRAYEFDAPRYDSVTPIPASRLYFYLSAECGEASAGADIPLAGEMTEDGRYEMMGMYGDAPMITPESPIISLARARTLVDAGIAPWYDMEALWPSLVLAMTELTPKAQYRGERIFMPGWMFDAYLAAMFPDLSPKNISEPDPASGWSARRVEEGWSIEPNAPADGEVAWDAVRFDFIEFGPEGKAAIPLAFTIGGERFERDVLVEIDDSAPFGIKIIGQSIKD